MRLDEKFNELMSESERRARECLEIIRNCPPVTVTFKRHRQIKRDNKIRKEKNDGKII